MKRSVLLALLLTLATLAPGTGPQQTEAAPAIQDRAVKPPVPNYSPTPPYTEEARRNKVTGSAVLRFKVMADGTVAPETVVVVRGIGYGMDESAVETVRTWRFNPATKDGMPVDFDITVDITFRLL